MSRRRELPMVAAGATAEEAAAVVAAVRRFVCDHGRAVTVPAAPPRRSPWLEASLHEGVARQPGLLPSWI